VDRDERGLPTLRPTRIPVQQATSQRIACRAGGLPLSIRTLSLAQTQTNPLSHHPSAPAPPPAQIAAYQQRERERTRVCLPWRRGTGPPSSFCCASPGSPPRSPSS
uniref:Uncharacterized protein n=1 Tax=Aegilops tauschii subsp. strangulata TaxID=200361 RepID=A0A453CL23_AEGTS